MNLNTGHLENVGTTTWICKQFENFTCLRKVRLMIFFMSMPRGFDQWTKVWKSTGNQGRLVRLQAESSRKVLIRLRSGLEDDFTCPNLASSAVAPPYVRTILRTNIFELDLPRSFQTWFISFVNDLGLHGDLPLLALEDVHFPLHSKAGHGDRI